MQSLQKIRRVLVSIPLAAAMSGLVLASDFSFDRHWKLPIPLQGEPPAGFSDIENSLLPEDCGTCHEDQFTEWMTSRHSRAMGPGIVGQLNPPWLEPETVEVCLDCHAPLGEQRLFTRTKNGGMAGNLHRQKDLTEQGVTCAGCHVRDHVRYGPSPRGERVEEPPHNGFVEVPNFGSSEFCKPCHQFGPEDNRVMGKLLEDTYMQWEQSRFAKEGVRCADCHMPDRRHLWRGIHDPEMVQKGVTIQAEKRGLEIEVAVTNTNVGHFFPTYVTPQVQVKGTVVVDGVAKHTSTHWIGWYVELNLSGERYDTRIPPGQRFSAKWKVPQEFKRGKYVVTVTVFPDEFYNRFFSWIIKNQPDGIDPNQIQEAYKITTQSPFVIFEKTWDLASGTS